MRTTTNTIHILPDLRSQSIKRKNLLPVSAVSKYGDLQWDFNTEIPNINICRTSKMIDWKKFTFNDESNLTDVRHEMLFESARDFIYSLRCCSPNTGKRRKSLTVVFDAISLRRLLNWMVDKNYNKFSQLDKTACDKYLKYVLSLPVSKSRQCFFLQILAKLFEQKTKINDAVQEHPYNYESIYDIAGYDQAELLKNKTLRIPEEVLTDLIGKALSYVETHASNIIKIQDEYERIGGQIKKRSAWIKFDRREKFCKSHGLSRIVELTQEVMYLKTACYIIIAFFSGMRDSETLSIEENCIKRKKLKKSNQSINRIYSLTYKLLDQPKLEHWMVPDIVKTAVDVLARLTASLRKKSGLKQLFLHEYDGNVKVLSNSIVNVNLRRFVKNKGVILNKCKIWHLHSHQFRRSFAYYMMKENKCNLKFLQQQFKHLSMDMTLWYAETGDEDLKQDVYAMSVEVARDILRPILLNPVTLAGKGGEQIMSNREAYFSGKTVREKESLFQEIISDLYVRSTYLGLCVWNPEHAQCEAGFECRCNPNICKNAVVTSEHLPLWTRLKERHEKLLLQPNIEPMKRQYIQTQLDTFVMPILKKLQRKSIRGGKVENKKRESRSPKKCRGQKKGFDRGAHLCRNKAN